MDEKVNKKMMKAVEEAHYNHKGEWLTMDIAIDYREKGKRTSTYQEKKVLCNEMMEKYGILELEAINILNGFWLQDYVRKYYRIQNFIPLDVKKKSSGNKNEDVNE